MIFASFGLPERGDRHGKIAPMNRQESIVGSKNAASYYIQNSYKDAHTPNMVTVTLADYRGYDTLGEETVIMTAGLVCFLILRKKRLKNDKK